MLGEVGGDVVLGEALGPVPVELGAGGEQSGALFVQLAHFAVDLGSDSKASAFRWHAVLRRGLLLT